MNTSNEGRGTGNLPENKRRSGKTIRLTYQYACPTCKRKLDTKPPEWIKIPFDVAKEERERKIWEFNQRMGGI